MRAIPLFTAALSLSIVSGIAGAQDKTRPKADEKDEKARIEKIESRDGRVRVYTSGDGIDVAPGDFAFSFNRSPRAMIGVNTSSSGARDTLGLLVTSVTPGGPAEKAGIIEGNRIAAINSVNLRLAAADAGQEDMEGITARRLSRELGKLQPGAEVDLRIYADGQWKNVKVRTVSSDSLRSERSFNVARTARDERPVLGFTLNSSGNKRDTLGVLIANVEENGPAEKAGLVEGDRVAAVNGTDLRVKREDVGDDYVANAMVSRFQRVMRSAKPGDKVELRVYSGGQTKTVNITAARAADIYKDSARRFRMVMPGSAFRMAPMPPMPAMPAMPPMPPDVVDGDVWFDSPTPAIAPLPMRIRRGQIHSMDLQQSDDIDVDDDSDADSDIAPDIDFETIPDVDIAPPAEFDTDGLVGLDAARRAVDAAERAKADDSDATAAIRARDEAKSLNEQTRRMVESMLNKQRSLDRATAKSARWTPSAWAAIAPAGGAFDVRAAAAKPASSTFRIAGLTLARVTSDLAEYLGDGSRDGLLVLESEGEWSAVHPGDVLLSVNGQCVNGAGKAALNSEDAHDIVVLRQGRKMTVHLVGG